MSVRQEFDAWAADGRDRGMEERHWHTAKHALARMPVDEGDRVLDLGTGSGYIPRAIREATGAGRVYGLDGSPEMAANARSYTDDPQVGFVVADFGVSESHRDSEARRDAERSGVGLPFADDSLDHVWSMEAFYYAADPDHTLEEVARVLRPGGTFYCAVNFYEENVHSHDWQENIAVEMTRWSRAEYRAAFERAGLHVAEQDTIPDEETDIPPESEFPHEGWERREDMVERYRVFGTLLTVGVAP
jgi:ubiquinone/menaquinone biosynthesis C-methylase UbiE